jgi:endonuclease/exonuclease/phosphatase (EEP) superfamily protein YafD
VPFNHLLSWKHLFRGRFGNERLIENRGICICREERISKFFESVKTAATLVIIVSTVLPLIRWDDWWIRWFDFPRLQILIMGMVLVGLQLFRGVKYHWSSAILLSMLLITVGYQMYRIFPYTPLSRVQVPDSNSEENAVTLRIITANVLMKNREAEKYLQVLAETDPDIILTTEADQWWMVQLKALDRSYPHQVKYPLENTYGIILHSRFPLIEPSVRFLVEPMVPSIHTGIRLPGDHLLRFIGLHPRPPGPTENEESTERDAELIMVANAVKGSDLPVLILGDLNDVAWSHTTTLFQKISGLLDPRVGRGMFNSYHADYWFLRFPLDHIFHSAHFKFIDMRRLPHIGSDHFPIYAALSFHPQKAPAQTPPAPTSEERQEAKETVEEAKKKEE